MIGDRHQKQSARRRTRPAPAAGFTLLEIVVALAILATALVILLESQYGSLRLFDDARHEIERDRFVRWAVGIAETEVLAGNRSGGKDFSRRYKDWSYRFSATPVEGSRLPGLIEIKLTITEPNKERRELSLLVFDPAQPQ
jgi:prepilin-type N-terminal cleavage/methylation domain-containing protein